MSWSYSYYYDFMVCNSWRGLCKALVHTHDKNLLCATYYGKQWGYEDAVFLKHTSVCSLKAYTPIKKSDHYKIGYNKCFK